MICKNCNNNNIDGVKFCFYCGCELISDNSVKQENVTESVHTKDDTKTTTNISENINKQLINKDIGQNGTIGVIHNDTVSANENANNKKTFSFNLNKKIVIIGGCVTTAFLLVIGVVIFSITSVSNRNSQNLYTVEDYSEVYNNDNYDEETTESMSDDIDNDDYNNYIDSDNEPDNSNSESLSAEIEYDEEDSSLEDAYYFTSARASSVLPDEFEYNYSASNVLENDSACWCEGSSGLGVGEWIELELPETQLLYGLDIINGYAGTQKQYTYNGKVNKIYLEFSDGTTLHTSLKVFDVSNRKKVQTIKFNYPVETSYVRITIEGVDAGECDDTCITYIAPYDR